MANEIISRKALIVSDRRGDDNPAMRDAVRRLAVELERRGVRVTAASGYDTAYPLVESDMDIDAFLIESDLEAGRIGEAQAARLLRHVKERQGKVPVFLLADRERLAGAISEELLALASEFVWIFEDSPAFIAGRIAAAIGRFRDQLLPPLMRAIWEYNEQQHEYSWAAPGHQGGIGFTKSPTGKKFYDFYGENLFRTDTGIERVSIGSLLDHSGAFGESEREAARVFGADCSYSVIAGTSGSNRTVMQISLTEGDVALCDRNCHKSIEQGLILSGAVPVYLVPTRNRYGIIGPILPENMAPEVIEKGIRELPFPHREGKAAYAVVTNCTYDGLCYNAAKVEQVLGPSCRRLHFDEAWYAYARFHPLYRDHFAMRGDPAARRHGPTVFATHSTHKLLNALSQASYIHVRHGDDPIDFNRFNQAYMLHSTTSPLYAICASNDISAAMMKECGQSLIREVIAEAVDFRQALARLHRDFERRHSWFFRPWNADRVTERGKTRDFADASRVQLIENQACWRLEPGETWHGFPLRDEDWVMLDPIKVSILAPGMGDDGRPQETGVPAALVSSWLYRAGIVPTRTTDFQLMFLFSMGITKGKWGTLLNALLGFKQAYDANAPLAETLPELAAAHPAAYRGMGLRDLGERMFDYLRRERPDERLGAAFRELPTPSMTPRAAFSRIVTGDVEMVPTESLAGRIPANSLIPYPPGIPLLISGERFGGDDSPHLAYLRALAAWDRAFPGFEHVTEGVEIVDGVYRVMCVKE